MEERTKTHLLKIKSEKLGEMIQQHVNQATWGGSAVTGASGPDHTHRHNTAPYPIYGNRMPQMYMPPVSS